METLAVRMTRMVCPRICVHWSAPLRQPGPLPVPKSGNPKYVRSFYAYFPGSIKPRFCHCVPPSQWSPDSGHFFQVGYNLFSYVRHIRDLGDRNQGQCVWPTAVAARRRQTGQGQPFRTFRVQRSPSLSIGVAG